MTTRVWMVILITSALTGCSSHQIGRTTELSLTFSDKYRTGCVRLVQIKNGAYFCEYNDSDQNSMAVVVVGVNAGVHSLFEELRSAAQEFRCATAGPYRLDATFMSSNRADQLRLFGGYEEFKTLFGCCLSLGPLFCDIASQCAISKNHWYYDLADKFYSREADRDFGRLAGQ